MSRLAHAGDSSTVSPGCAARGGRAHRLLAAWRSARSVQTPASARSISRRVAADQHRVAHLAAEGRRERREVLVLAVAARDHDQRPVHAGDRRERRADIGALGVVDVA